MKRFNPCIRIVSLPAPGFTVPVQTAPEPAPANNTGAGAPPPPPPPPPQDVAPVAPAASIPGLNMIETVHTKKGHPIFVVQLTDRVERAEYERINAICRQHGGYYSRFRGRGAVPGFTFQDKSEALAFMQAIAPVQHPAADPSPAIAEPAEPEPEVTPAPPETPQPAPEPEPEPSPTPTVADICQGRTIWNSDGTDGTCLVCLPPKAPAASVPAWRKRLMR
jgi:hypothetical protein